MLKQTALHSEHQRLGAKLVDFAGWDMPIHYGSQLEEHHAVRTGCGMFDVAHMAAVDLHGARTREFLRRLVANDAAKLKAPGKALYTCMLNEQGGVIDDLIVYFQREDWFRLVVNAGTTDKDLAWIRKQAAAFGVEVKHRSDLGILAVQGPKVRELVKPLLPEGIRDAALALKAFQSAHLLLRSAEVSNDSGLGQPSTLTRPFSPASPFKGEASDPSPLEGEGGREAPGEGGEPWFVATTGYTGEDGYEFILPHAELASLWKKLLDAGVKPCGLGARDTLRLEAGMNLYGLDMDESVTPLECGLAWTVAFDPADRTFIGRTVLDVQRAHPPRKTLGLVLEGRGVLRSHMKVRFANEAEGETTSGGFAPTMKTSIALARVPAHAQGNCEVEIRGQWLPARIVQPPFVRNGKVLV